jgi:uncharacterized protein YukE
MTFIRHKWVVGLVCLLAASLARPADAQLRPAHVDLKSSRALKNREQIFKHLATGGSYVPTWMRGKSRAQVNAWSKRMKQAIHRNATKVVQRIVENPGASASRRERMILGLVSPSERALLLKDVAGFKVEKVKYKVGGVPTTKYKVRLKRYGYQEYGYGDPPAEFKKQMDIYNRVMGAGIIIYAPAGGHSKYVSQGHMLDLYGSNGYGNLRPNNHPLFPVWLSDGEASRMKQIFQAGNDSWSYSMGTKMSHGRPGMWPPTRTQRAKTGNSCTTTFIRAPVGERKAEYAWIDKLLGKVQQAAKAGRVQVQGVDLKKNTLLEAVTGKTQAEYRTVFAKLKQKMRGQARDLAKLEGEVDFFYDKLKGQHGARYDWQARSYIGGTDRCTFPMDLMHRTPLAELAKITGDPVGPGMGKQKFRAADPRRIGVVTVFDRERRR